MSPSAPPPSAKHISVRNALQHNGNGKHEDYVVVNNNSHSLEEQDES
jgi:hypothetical protein